jgi:hypothetical protein
LIYGSLLAQADVVSVVARVFHAQALLSGQPFSARRFFAAFLGK